MNHAFVPDCLTASGERICDVCGGVERAEIHVSVRDACPHPRATHRRSMMPLLKSKHDYAKVYRPKGTRYAQGRGSTTAEAIAEARTAFCREFGSQPRQDQTVFEVIGVTASWVCDLFEIKE